MKKFGKTLNILVDSLGASQLSYVLTKKCNDLCSKNEASVVVFYDHVSAYHIQPFFPTMQMMEHISQGGISVATSIDTANKLLSSFGAEKRFYYMWDWPFVTNMPMYEKVINILLAPELQLIARCESHALAIQNFCNKKVNYVFDNFNSIKEVLC